MVAGVSHRWSNILPHTPFPIDGQPGGGICRGGSSRLVRLIANLDKSLSGGERDGLVLRLADEDGDVVCSWGIRASRVGGRDSASARRENSRPSEKGSDLAFIPHHKQGAIGARIGFHRTEICVFVSRRRYVAIIAAATQRVIRVARLVDPGGAKVLAGVLRVYGYARRVPPDTIIGGAS